MPIEITLKNSHGFVIVRREVLNFEQAHAELDKLEIYIKRLYKAGLTQNNVSKRPSRQRKNIRPN